MRAPALLLVTMFLGCSLGERGGKQEAAPTAKPAAPATAAAPAAPAGPGTCEATANKLVALSAIDAEAKGQPWTEQLQTRQTKLYRERCTKELAEGVVTREAMLCVEGSKDLEAARGCLLAIAK